MEVQRAPGLAAFPCSPLLPLPPPTAAPTGAARAHLHSWIAAAVRIQRQVRVFLARRGLARAAQLRQRREAAVVQLQARWRAAPVRRSYLQLRSAAISVQVRSCEGGWREGDHMLWSQVVMSCGGACGEALWFISRCVAGSATRLTGTARSFTHRVYIAAVGVPWEVRPSACCGRARRSTNAGPSNCSAR